MIFANSIPTSMLKEFLSRLENLVNLEDWNIYNKKIEEVGRRVLNLDISKKLKI